jgi:hypothetical protein
MDINIIHWYKEGGDVFVFNKASNKTIEGPRVRILDERGSNVEKGSTGAHRNRPLCP